MEKKAQNGHKTYFYFNTFACKLIVMQLCSQVKLVLFLSLEMAGCSEEWQHPALQQTVIFFSMDILFVKFHCLHSTNHFSAKAQGNRKDGVERFFISTGEIPSKIVGGCLKKESSKKILGFFISSQ